MSVYDCIVVGAGIEGSASAHYLAKNGHRTLLLEQFPLPHTRGSSHGQTRIIRKAYTQAIFANMMKEAYPMWRKLERETGILLQRTTGILAMGVNKKGYVDRVKNTLTSNGMKYTELNSKYFYDLYDISITTGILAMGVNKKGYVAEVKNALTSNGMKYTELNSKDLHDLYDISVYPDSSAIMDPEGGILKSDTALQTYQNQFIKHGGVILDKTELFSLQPGEIITLHTNRGAYVARSVILCLGPWAGRFLNKLGVQFPLKAVRISVGYFKAKIPDQYEVGKFLPFIYDTDLAHFYGIPSYEYPGLVKVALHDGPVIDPDRRDQVENDWAIKTCSEFVKDVFPGLEPDPCIVEHCIYTKTPDEHFVLDKHPLHPNLIIGAGFSGHGFKLAPVVGKILGNLAMGKASTYDLSQFRIDRFQWKASL